jgi:hypothetical protein
MIKTLARYKNYLARSNGYISLSTFGLVLWQITPDWRFPFLAVAGVSALLYAGYLDCKLGILREEQRHIHTHNPLLTGIYDKLDELEKKIAK